MPSLRQIIDSLVLVAEWGFVLFPIISIYVTLVHYKWWRTYRPSPLIRHLLISSAAVDYSALAVAFVVLNALDIIPIDLEPGVNTLILASALFVSMGVKVYRRINLRALDHPDADVQQRIETQDQREDREFGEQRRDLEKTHNADKGS